MTARPFVLDPLRPLAHLREEAGLTQLAAGSLLGIPPPANGQTCTTLASREQRGGTVQLRHLLTHAAVYGFEIEIRVRRKAGD